MSMVVKTKTDKFKFIKKLFYGDSKALSITILIGFILRLVYSIIIILNGVYYFEYGIILNNIFEGNGYSYTFNYFENPLTVPSAYMPPGYVFFLFPFYLLSNSFLKDFLVLFSQNILSCITIYFLYKLTRKYFNTKISLVTASLYSFLPDFIYISNTVTPTTLFHFFILILMFILSNEDNKSKTKMINGMSAGLVTGIIFLFRGEFFLFAALISLYFLYKCNFRFLIYFYLLIVFMITPWIVRNYSVFNDFIPSSTNFGLNFYRGHNIYKIGNWGDEKILSELNKIQGENNFEPKMSQIFLSRSFEMLKEDPSFEILNSIKKIFHLWVISPIGFQTLYYPALILWIFLLPFIIYGIIHTFSFVKFKFIYIYIIYFNIIAVLFFVLIRYQIMFKILLLPFCAYGITLFSESIKEYFAKRKLIR